jgi:hypothetical protein
MKCGYFWEDVFIEIVELPIEIFSAEAGPIISHCYSIWVEHGDNIEGK